MGLVWVEEERGGVGRDGGGPIAHVHCGGNDIWRHAPSGRMTVSRLGAPAAWQCCQWLRGLGARSARRRWSSCARVCDFRQQVPSSAGGPSDGLGEGRAIGRVVQGPQA